MECRQEHFISFVHLFGESKKYPVDTIFSKHLFVYRNAGTHIADHEKGYVECMEEDVEDALEKSMNLIKSADGNDFDLVLYKEALHHAAKISRTLVCALFPILLFLNPAFTWQQLLAAFVFTVILKINSKRLR